MSEHDNDTTRQEAPTRREYVKYGGAVVGGSLLAGCAGQSDSGSTPTETADAETATDTSTPENESYSVTMSPVGTVEFETVPSDVMTWSQQYIDAIFTVDHIDSITGVGFPDLASDEIQYYLSNIDDLTFSVRDVANLNEEGLSKETLYELGTDIHLYDPAWLITKDGWDQSDIEEITQNVGPFLGNRHSLSHDEPPEAYREGYEYYTLHEYARRIAAVFRREERIDQMEAVYTDLLSTIKSGLPPESGHPKVGACYYFDNKIYPTKFSDPGISYAHKRPFPVVDAFSDINAGTIDFETLLEVDPEVLLIPGGFLQFYNMKEIRNVFKDDPVGAEVTAVKNNQIYVSGRGFQGPTMVLFNIEMMAKQLFPDQFGEWPRYEAGEGYPEFSEDEQLFDRQRVSDIINGDG